MINSLFGGVMNKIIFSIFSLLILFTLNPVHGKTSDTALDKQFPNRKFYPGLNYIDTRQMVNIVNRGKYNVVDARPKLPFQTLHIKEAANIPAGDRQFSDKLMKVVSANKKPIVFYCGGLACLKSYKASVKAMNILRKKNIQRDVYTYDSGISAFAHANPGKVLKNGKDISPDNPLLDLAKIKKHAKTAQDFTNLIDSDESDKYVILDIRERKQKILSKLFMFKKEKKITLLQPEKLIAFLNEVKQSGKTLMVYSSVEKQIESLYPLVKTSGTKKWFYLEGGEHAYSQYMIQQHVTSTH